MPQTNIFVLEAIF